MRHLLVNPRGALMPLHSVCICCIRFKPVRLHTARKWPSAISSPSSPPTRRQPPPPHSAALRFCALLPLNVHGCCRARKLTHRIPQPPAACGRASADGGSGARCGCTRCAQLSTAVLPRSSTCDGQNDVCVGAGGIALPARRRARALQRLHGARSAGSNAKLTDALHLQMTPWSQLRATGAAPSGKSCSKPRQRAKSAAKKLMPRIASKRRDFTNQPL
jgi:hypothetical protein